jgi:superoxide reductase
MQRDDINLNRRGLAKAAFLGVAAAATLPAAARAQAASDNSNVVFTESDPGHWAKGKAVHLPVVTVTGSAISVKTPHPMTEAHFIVSHTVVLAGGKYLGRKTFTAADQPVSEYTLPADYKGKIIVTSTCNLHDLWLTTITV